MDTFVYNERYVKYIFEFINNCRNSVFNYNTNTILRFNLNSINIMYAKYINICFDF